MNAARWLTSIARLASACALLCPTSALCLAADGPQSSVPSSKTAGVGERVPSEDESIKDFHCLGLIQGHTNIFRSASPVRDLVDNSGKTTDGAQEEAKRRLQHLYDLGIRTIISFETPDESEPKAASAEEDKAARTKARVSLEKKAAAAVGINYVSRPIKNAGSNSLEGMTDEDVCKLLESTTDQIFAEANRGGVLFHCSAGHDRTGIVSAYMRMKYQHWPVDQAIDEMRRYGHNWPKFSHDGGNTSWHEEHLRAIESQMTTASK